MIQENKSIMKTVDEAALRRQLEAARHGTPDEQKAFLQSIDDVLANEGTVVLNTMMNDSDLVWLKPLALDLFLPAVEKVVEGMQRKCRIYEEDVVDEESHNVETLFRVDIIEDATVFTPAPDLIDQIKNTIFERLKSIDTVSLYRLNIPLYGIEDVIEEELISRDDPSALLRRGDLYRWGNEENGIFINYATAKTYYDRSGLKEFIEEDVAREDRKEATESFPEFATYRLEGSDVPAVKQLLNTLYEKYGEHTELFMYLPLEKVMLSLVGSDAYVGYIQSIDETEGFSFEVEFYGCRVDCLKYALEQTFLNLKVKFTEHCP